MNFIRDKLLPKEKKSSKQKAMSENHKRLLTVSSQTHVVVGGIIYKKIKLLIINLRQTSIIDIVKKKNINWKGNSYNIFVPRQRISTLGFEKKKHFYNFMKKTL